MYLKEEDAFLMASKKRPNNSTSNYLICMDKTDLNNRENPAALGKLRSNMSGSEYTIYDSGISRREYSNDILSTDESCLRTELGAVLYEKDRQKQGGPREMKVCINKVDNGSEFPIWRPLTKSEEMLTLLKHKIDTARTNLIVLENKIPEWNEQLGAYVLNFNGRVTMESVKNFQLVHVNGKDENVVLQFGRVAKDEFTMDFRWPLSPFLAFALSLSSCDSKIACD